MKMGMAVRYYLLCLYLSLSVGLHAALCERVIYAQNNWNYEPTAVHPNSR